MKRKDRRIIRVGEKYGQLELVEDLGMVGRDRLARFKCDCGKVVVKHVRNVVSGKTQTCCHLYERLNNGNKLESKEYIEEQKEGFFNVDDYYKSDFIYSY
jgi:hypothetical protein